MSSPLFLSVSPQEHGQGRDSDGGDGLRLDGHRLPGGQTTEGAVWFLAPVPGSSRSLVASRSPPWALSRLTRRREFTMGVHTVLRANRRPPTQSCSSSASVLPPGQPEFIREGTKLGLCSSPVDSLFVYPGLCAGPFSVAITKYPKLDNVSREEVCLADSFGT